MPHLKLRSASRCQHVRISESTTSFSLGSVWFHFSSKMYFHGSVFTSMEVQCYFFKIYFQNLLPWNFFFPKEVNCFIFGKQNHSTSLEVKTLSQESKKVLYNQTSNHVGDRNILTAFAGRDGCCDPSVTHTARSPPLPFHHTSWEVARIEKCVDQAQEATMRNKKR